MQNGSFRRAVAWSGNCMILVPILLSCIPGIAHTAPVADRHLIIAVVGDGVPPIRTDIERPFPLNRNQGQAMYDGAVLALAQSPSLRPFRGFVEIRGYDDGATDSSAATIARRLIIDKNVLAIIGHATSQSTRAAAHIYAKAGIPLLMPIATSKTVMLPPGADEGERARLRNCFRLVPSDDRAQAPAVVYLVDKIGRGSVGIVKDRSQGAREYSEPLAADIYKHLKTRVIKIYSSDGSLETYRQIASSLQDNDCGVLVFCGYATSAIDLFVALRTAYAAVPCDERPKVVLTDGCLDPDLNCLGFEVLVTFPPREWDAASETNRSEQQVLEQQYGVLDTLSYQPYGYDAMLVLAGAMAQCRGSAISRARIIDLLSESDGFCGTMGTYAFAEGENTLAEYDVFACPDSAGRAFSRIERISAGTLRGIYVRGGR